ncbi:paraslipin [Leptothermofonsia sichuanensis E412]|uniref:SPFH domain-containing protein n=1 Tax=Leptothermofonsia sichuanensis TaxID=2917832 RepID=UPI001CA752C5|nr:stomatin-like protein [Leptothermofonsia sichuanensis]QZZ20119.1 paraslipin [Leptothermofonsia sichuanensis E412]
MEPLLAALTLAIVGYIFGSIKIIYQGNEALVERFGQYRRTLKPGLNFVIPVIDTVIEESTREQLLDIEPQSAITKDNVTLQVDAVMYWRILDVQKAYYAIEDLGAALKNLVITTLRSQIGSMDLRETVSSRSKINKALLSQLDEATESWGVKVIRVEVQDIKLSDALRDALEKERTAESLRKAAISETEGMVASIEQISRAIQAQPNSEMVLKYLIAQKYVDANYNLGKSNNSKVVFMDPGQLTEAVSHLIHYSEKKPNPDGGSSSNPE